MQRARHADRFSLNFAHIRRLHGFGKGSFYSALSTLKRTGYLTRFQERNENGYEYATETLNLSVAPASGRDGFEFLRENMAGLGWRDQAVFDYLCSHAPGFPMTADMIGSRFGVSEKTIRRALDRLSADAHVELLIDRDARGRFLQKGFSIVRACSRQVDHPDKNRKQSDHPDIYGTQVYGKQDSGKHNKDDPSNKRLPFNKDQASFACTSGAQAQPEAETRGASPGSGKGKSAHLTNNSSVRSVVAKSKVAANNLARSSSSTEATSPLVYNTDQIVFYATGRKAGVHAEQPKAANDSRARPRRPKGGDARLFDGSENDRLIEIMLEPQAVADNLAAIEAYVSDSMLISNLNNATDGRIGRNLLSAEGLAVARQLIAADAYYRNTDIETEAEAWEAFREFLTSLIVPKSYKQGKGKKGPWLNSWSLIAKRQAGDAYHYAGMYEEFESSEPDCEDDVPF
jgi:hypothetical protein